MSRLPDEFSAAKRMDEAVRETAALWVVRHDRGLTDSERVEFEGWRSADPRHDAAWRRSTQVWDRFEPAVGSARPAEMRSRRPRRNAWLALGGLAAGLVLVFSVGTFRPGGLPAGVASVDTPAPANEPRTVTLPDGTLVRLNAGAVLAERYTRAERTVQLVHGEAYFAVVKEAVRPFVVEVGGVRVRAVGTAFGVSVAADAVDVLVTEGTVEVDASRGNAPTVAVAEPRPLVTAGHRAVVSRATASAAPTVSITAVDLLEVNQANSWRGGLLRLGGARLGELAVEFERLTGRRLIIDDPELRAMSVGGRFPGNDVDGFVRVLEQHYGVRAQRLDDGSLRLSRAP